MTPILGEALATPAWRCEHLNMAIPVCPEQDGPIPAFFPDDTNPNRYYECSNGKPILMSCHPGLVWSQDVLCCVLPTDE